MKPLRTTLSTTSKQRGAVLMVMLVIMIMGVSFLLVSALSKVTLQNARDEKSSEILAQAKEVVIGQLLKGGALPPGWLLRPDVRDVPNNTDPIYPEISPINNSLTSNYDGDEDNGCFDNTQAAANPPYTPLLQVNNTNMSKVRCLGRLPWKSLGMSISTPSENDPTGVMPWLAFSRNLRNPSIPVNSELLNSNNYWLKVYDMKGTLLSDRVAIVIILPGVALSNQSRPPSPNLANPDQYLDKISLPPGCIGAGCISNFNNANLSETFVTGDEHRWMDDPANPGKQIEDPTYQFNDKLLYVTIDDLMPLIEKRIAREVKACLDDYANATINSGHKYPWAAPVSDTTNYQGIFGLRFGRFPTQLNINTNGPSVTVLAQINALQTALTAYLNAPGAGTLSNLKNAGDTLKDNSTSGTPAYLAGQTADNCTNLSCNTAYIQTQLNTALVGSSPDGTMTSAWSSIPSCDALINHSSYWPDWQSLVFYQVADGYQPGGAGSCTPNTTCLSIVGTGNPVAGSGKYRASVLIAGKMLTGQNPRNQSTPPTTYLETAGAYTNAHSSVTGVIPSSNFITYKPSDTANYTTVNDLVLCLDGKGNNLNSVCQ